MEKLVQHLVSDQPEKGYERTNALPLQRFLSLLKDEEDYWAPEQHNTKLIISHARKIFYDQWGWNDQLITGASEIANRYEVHIIEADPKAPKPAAEADAKNSKRQLIKKAYRHKEKVIISKVDAVPDEAKELTLVRNNNYEPKYRHVVYRNDDKIFGASKAGETPVIYASNHQEVMLPDGTICDLGHVLAGLDAKNYLNVVTPLPDFFNFAKCFMPQVDKNTDIVTWLGDIASVAGNFLFHYRQNKKYNNIEEEQFMINSGAPGSDMLGNIDSFVIAKSFDIASTDGKRLTEILEEYYLGTATVPPLRNKRFSIFAHETGLRGWDAQENKFQNETDWIAYYKLQLRDNTCFQVMSLMDKSFKSILLVFRIWYNGYQGILKLETLLEIFLDALKEKIKLEP